MIGGGNLYPHVRQIRIKQKSALSLVLHFDVATHAPSSGLINVEETVELCSTLLQTYQSQTFKPAVPALYCCEGVHLLARTPK
jgi:hypothetical protein